MPGPRRALLPALLVLLAAVGPADALQAPPTFADGARTAGDELVPGVGNGGYDVGAYRLDLRATAKARRIAGTAELDATATQDLRSFSLDLLGLRVSAVRVGGAATPFRQTRHKLIVTPPGGLAAGTAFTAAIDYGGRPRPLSDMLLGLTGWVPTRGGAFVASEPAGSRTWFPVNDRPDDKATFALRMNVPRRLRVIGNGSLRSRVIAGGRTTFEWVEDRPVQTYLDTANIGRFEVLRGTSRSGLPLYSGIERGRGGAVGFGDVAAFKPARVRKARRVLRQAGNTIDRLASIFGPYPFGAGGGVLRRTSPLRYALETSSRPSYYDLLDPETQAHELAHQWFGDTVTLTQWRDIWLHEGFATWAQWWFTHERDPRRATVAQRAARVYRTPARERGRVPSLWRPVIPRRSRDLFGQAVYERGGMTLEALRQRVGDATFRQILQTWVAEHRYANATTAQFIELAQRLSGQDLGPFFRDWLDERGKPVTSPPRAGF